MPVSHSLVRTQYSTPFPELACSIMELTLNARMVACTPRKVRNLASEQQTQRVLASPVALDHQKMLHDDLCLLPWLQFGDICEQTSAFFISLLPPLLLAFFSLTRHRPR